MPLCFISIGSNINREHNIRSALDALQATFGSLQNSSIYESSAVGFEGDAFYNLVSVFSCEQEIAYICQHLKTIENNHGRVRSGEKFSSRTLDIDLLLYGQHIIQTKKLTIPHQDILNYAFVLEPLVELAADDLHPVTQVSYAQLWSDFDKSELQQHTVDDVLF
ncbi:MAG: 2-amino-4-hydroxy-6-hydroxymethyldihydropteridine diphosphokinase [Methyloprofundus sp.]|nr:2-amino-4-hydroxy-6-hydroxymethyldihydropteridine diphosphokinase [Methyloprofundus sp.]